MSFDRLFEPIRHLHAIGTFSLDALIEASYWVILTSIGGLLPLWGGFLVLRAFSQTPSLMAFAETGEFVVFGASVLSSSLFTVTKEIRPNISSVLKGDNGFSHLANVLRITFPLHRPISLVSLTLILLATLAFSIVTISHIPGVAAPLDQTFLRTLTMVVFVGALIIGISVAMLDEAHMSQMQFKNAREDELSTLDAEIDALGE